MIFILGEADDIPDIVLDHNVSERFECRFSTVRIEKSRSMMLQGMADSTLGVWVAHGEGTLFSLCFFHYSIFCLFYAVGFHMWHLIVIGNFTMRDSSILQKLESESCIALRYVSDNGQPTMEYPLNPNGSAGKYGSKLIIQLGNFISVILKSFFGLSFPFLRCFSRSLFSRWPSFGYDAPP